MPRPGRSRRLAQARRAGGENRADRGAVRDRLRPLGPAAHRHVRRGRPHLDGAPRLRGADEDGACPRPASSPSPTTWTGCARCRTTCRTKDCLREHLNKPLTKVPDPFGTHASFGAHNNAMLRGFLDRFGFDYELRLGDRLLHLGPVRRGACCTCCATSTKVMAIMLPTFREERAATYSPFLPIHPRDRRRDAGAARRPSTRTSAPSPGAIPTTGELLRRRR